MLAASLAPSLSHASGFLKSNSSALSQLCFFFWVHCSEPHGPAHWLPAPLNDTSSPCMASTAPLPAFHRSDAARPPLTTLSPVSLYHLACSITPPLGPVGRSAPPDSAL